MDYDAVIVGAGPAGCSCALWLAEFGLAAALIDRAPAPCATLDALTFAQRWVLGQPDATLAEVGAQYRRDIAARSDIAQHYGSDAVALQRRNTEAAGAQASHGGWVLHLADGSRWQACTVVLATGLQPVQPKQYFNAELESPALHDATSLTANRAALAGRRVLLLGGGDNAAENALALAALGCRITVVSRSPLRAQRRYAVAMTAHPAISVHAPAALPVLARLPDGRYSASGFDGAYDAVAVLFGYRANLALLQESMPADGDTVPLPPGVFLAGDVSGRLHPCVPSAVGDGAHAAWLVERWLAAHPHL